MKKIFYLIMALVLSCNLMAQDCEPCEKKKEDIMAIFPYLMFQDIKNFYENEIGNSNFLVYITIPEKEFIRYCRATINTEELLKRFPGSEYLVLLSETEDGSTRAFLRKIWNNNISPLNMETYNADKDSYLFTKKEWEFASKFLNSKNSIFDGFDKTSFNVDKWKNGLDASTQNNEVLTSLERNIAQLQGRKAAEIKFGDGERNLAVMPNSKHAELSGVIASAESKENIIHIHNKGILRDFQESLSSLAEESYHRYQNVQVQLYDKFNKSNNLNEKKEYIESAATIQGWKNSFSDWNKQCEQLEKDYPNQGNAMQILNNLVKAQDNTPDSRRLNKFYNDYIKLAHEKDAKEFASAVKKVIYQIFNN